MNRIEEWLQAYETDVHFPDVSGMEHLDMLLTRSKIADMADIANWRKHAKALRAHWWWYLDVVVHIPVMPIQPRVSYPVAIAAQIK